MKYLQEKYYQMRNIVEISKESVFSFEEKKKFWITKWRKEHIGLFVFLISIDVLFVVYAVVTDKMWLTGLMSIILFIEYGGLNNKMMIYVENHLYKKWKN